MNSWKFNGMAGRLARQAIFDSLRIKSKDLYKIIKFIDSDGVIVLKDGREFKLILKELR